MRRGWQQNDGPKLWDVICGIFNACVVIAVFALLLGAILSALVGLTGCTYDNLINVDLHRECDCPQERNTWPREPGLYGEDGERLYPGEELWSL